MKNWFLFSFVPHAVRSVPALHLKLVSGVFFACVPVQWNCRSGQVLPFLGLVRISRAPVRIGLIF
jgi:hypothetical protein